MKISDLKKKYNDMANSNLDVLRHGDIPHGVEIKENYIIARRDYEKIVLKAKQYNTKELEVELSTIGVSQWESKKIYAFTPHS